MEILHRDGKMLPNRCVGIKGCPVQKHRNITVLSGSIGSDTGYIGCNFDVIEPNFGGVAQGRQKTKLDYVVSVTPMIDNSTRAYFAEVSENENPEKDMLDSSSSATLLQPLKLLAKQEAPQDTSSHAYNFNGEKDPNRSFTITTSDELSSTENVEQTSYNVEKSSECTYIRAGEKNDETTKNKVSIVNNGLEYTNDARNSIRSGSDSEDRERWYNKLKQSKADYHYMLKLDRDYKSKQKHKFASTVLGTLVEGDENVSPYNLCDYISASATGIDKSNNALIAHAELACEYTEETTNHEGDLVQKSNEITAEYYRHNETSQFNKFQEQDGKSAVQVTINNYSEDMNKAEGGDTEAGFENEAFSAGGGYSMFSENNISGNNDDDESKLDESTKILSEMVEDKYKNSIIGPRENKENESTSAFYVADDNGSKCGDSYAGYQSKNSCASDISEYDNDSEDITDDDDIDVDSSFDVSTGIWSETVQENPGQDNNEAGEAVMERKKESEVSSGDRDSENYVGLKLNDCDDECKGEARVRVESSEDYIQDSDEDDENSQFDVSTGIWSATIQDDDDKEPGEESKMKRKADTGSNLGDGSERSDPDDDSKVFPASEFSEYSIYSCTNDNDDGKSEFDVSTGIWTEEVQDNDKDPGKELTVHKIYEDGIEPSAVDEESVYVSRSDSSDADAEYKTEICGNKELSKCSVPDDQDEDKEFDRSTGIWSETIPNGVESSKYSNRNDGGANEASGTEGECGNSLECNELYAGDENEAYATVEYSDGSENHISDLEDSDDDQSAFEVSTGIWSETVQDSDEIPDKECKIHQNYVYDEETATIEDDSCIKTVECNRIEFKGESIETRENEKNRDYMTERDSKDSDDSESSDLETASGYESETCVADFSEYEVVSENGVLNNGYKDTIQPDDMRRGNLDKNMHKSYAAEEDPVGCDSLKQRKCDAGYDSETCGTVGLSKKDVPNEDSVPGIYNKDKIASVASPIICRDWAQNKYIESIEGEESGGDKVSTRISSIAEDLNYYWGSNSNSTEAGIGRTQHNVTTRTDCDIASQSRNNPCKETKKVENEALSISKKPDNHLGDNPEEPEGIIVPAADIALTAISSTINPQIVKKQTKGLSTEVCDSAGKWSRKTLFKKDLSEPSILQDHESPPLHHKEKYISSTYSSFRVEKISLHSSHHVLPMVNYIQSQIENEGFSSVKPVNDDVSDRDNVEKLGWEGHSKRLDALPEKVNYERTPADGEQCVVTGYRVGIIDCKEKAQIPHTANPVHSDGAKIVTTGDPYSAEKIFVFDDDEDSPVKLYCNINRATEISSDAALNYISDCGKNDNVDYDNRKQPESNPNEEPGNKKHSPCSDSHNDITSEEESRKEDCKNQVNLGAQLHDVLESDNKSANEDLLTIRIPKEVGENDENSNNKNANNFFQTANDYNGTRNGHDTDDAHGKLEVSTSTRRLSFASNNDQARPEDDFNSIASQIPFTTRYHEGKDELLCETSAVECRTQCCVIQ